MISQNCRIGRGLVLCTAVFAVAAPAADDAAKVSRLSLEVQRAEDIRAVKKLEISYAQYLQFGLWSQTASLFTDNAEAIYGGDDLKGRAAIGKYFPTDGATAARACRPTACTLCLTTLPSSIFRLMARPPKVAGTNSG
ncbi:MAG: nuclear transport factor 2 family protein [Xanthobacteraceae bacterium]|jgi:hypothetical protein